MAIVRSVMYFFQSINGGVTIEWGVTQQVKEYKRECCKGGNNGWCLIYFLVRDWLCVCFYKNSLVGLTILRNQTSKLILMNTVVPRRKKAILFHFISFYI